MVKIALVLVASLSIAASLLFQNSVDLGLCTKSDYACRDIYNFWQALFRFAPFFLVVTLLAALLPARYFTSWLRFARLAGPLAIVLVMLINAGWHHTSGGWLNLSGALDDEGTWLVYTLFTIGSLWSLWRVRQEAARQ